MERADEIASFVTLVQKFLSVGQLEAAERICRRVLESQPGNAQALHLLGAVLTRVGSHAVALKFIEEAYALAPYSGEILSSRGAVLQVLGRDEDALACYTRALTLNPAFAEGHNNLGNLLLRLGKPGEALARYLRALEIKPYYVDALCNCGLALQSLNRFDEAIARLNSALDINPCLARAFCYRGDALQKLRRTPEALASYERALFINQNYAEALNNRGVALYELSRYEEALADYERALAIKPDYADAFNNKGLALYELKCHRRALDAYGSAIALRRDFAEAHWNGSLCRLALGDFADGWSEHEWRWRCSAFSSARRDVQRPLWLGTQPIAGKTILLHSEQGLGDTIQFCRYVPLVAKQRARIILEVQSPLKSLLSGMPGLEKVFSQGENLPAFDLHCPLMSLPLACGTRLNNVPDRVPYLHADPQAVENWRRRIGCKGKVKIGVAASGNRAHRRDNNRSIALSKFAVLARPDTVVVSLQNELRPEDERFLAESRSVLYFGSDLRDFADTAALVSAMDLVVSVDTAVAHLAGALGKRLWLLLPFSAEWRWLVDREDSPWYPTASLIRQPRTHDWDSVIASVDDRLRSQAMDILWGSDGSAPLPPHVAI